ncbi:MAG: CoA transferase, partial [Myxococcota bacterium]
MSAGLVSGAGAFAEPAAALSGVLLVDLSRDFGFAVSAAMLADFGATVVRVEPPGARLEASAARGEGPRQAARDHRAELAHRNKRSLALDLERAEGRAVLDELLARADVVVVDGSPGEIEARDLSPERLIAERPELIVARGSGFGPVGPDRELPAFDELAAARTGMMPLLPQPGQPPIYSGAG